MSALSWAAAAFANPMIGDVDFGPGCTPIPQGDDRWWSVGVEGHSMGLVTVDTAAHPRALCNDATAAEYYVRPGADAAPATTATTSAMIARFPALRASGEISIGLI